MVNTATASVPPSLPASPSDTSTDPVHQKTVPAVLTFKGVSVTLENNSVWQQFHKCGTEMILTKQGRRMFPYSRYRLAGLDPTRRYSLVLSIVPADQHRYRWNINKWEVSGPAEHQTQGLIRAFPHHYSPCLGSEWMNGLVSFYKLKLTNNIQDQEGHIILHSLHRYIPRLHVIPVLDGGGPTPDQPVVKGPESMTFTFPQTEFIAVTTYQNPRITQLKINHNPFAKGFREEGHYSRLNRIRSEVPPEGREDTQAPGLKPAGPSSSAAVSSEEVVNLSTKKHAISASLTDEREAETQAKQSKVATETSRVTAAPVSKEGVDVDNLVGDLHQTQHPKAKRGRPPKRLSLGGPPAPKPQPPSPFASARCEVPSPHRVLPVEPKEESKVVGTTPRATRCVQMAPKASATPPASSRSTPASSPGCPKKRRRINRRWGNSRGREAKAGAVSSAVAWSPALTVAMQPELDDVEGLLFVSFTSKEALGIHVGDKAANGSSPVSPVSLTPQSQSEQTAEEAPETDEDKIARLQAILLHDLKVLKYRQVIHPVLQEVGLKLSSLDPSMAIDLQYLGVCLPLPSPVQPGRDNTKALSSPAAGLPFVSRTGKTTDLTKIKGWRDKFIRSKDSSPSKHDGSPKDLSAFCSDMLDEYLESEARQISERAAAFSTNTEGSVAYQLPAKSSSYVKTLDSVLKHRNTTPKHVAWANRPCPLSYKPLLYSVLTTPAPPLASPMTSVQEAAKPKQLSVSPQPKSSALKTGQVTNKNPVPRDGTASGTKSKHGASPVSQRSPPCNPGISHKTGLSSGQNQGTSFHKTSGLSKFQLKLLEMEEDALNQGLNKTHLTPERLSMALSVILTAKMLPSQRFSVPLYKKATGPECGQEHCRLGCVCSSLNRLNRGPLHCRRPDCMLGCSCFKRKIIKQITGVETEKQIGNQIHPTYSLSNIESEVQPSPGSHADTLWNHNTATQDPEPLFTPKSAAVLPISPTPTKKRYVPRLSPQMQEADKDPVYKYLESFLTCARVREFKPSAEVHLPSKNPATPALNTNKMPQKTLNNLQIRPGTILTVKNTAGKASLQAQSKEPKPSKQMEIQSDCRWDMDRKMVLGALCRHMEQNSLSLPFSIGPYFIRLVSKISSRKASGPTVTYQVRISKLKKISDDDEEDGNGICGSNQEEELTDNDSDEDQEMEEEEEEEDFPTKEPEEVQVGVTPFLSGVLPAGRLTARKKPSGSHAVGLIQVNGKSYSQARLLLGNMGSLHPANRLAAYVTGRLHAASKIPQSNTQKTDCSKTHKLHTPAIELLKTAATMVPLGITGKTKVQKTPTGLLGQRIRPAILRKRSGTSPRPSQKQSAIKPLVTFVSGRKGSVTFHNTSSSPVSLTVSPVLKTPSFLGESGTYSFRICPPPANQGSRDPGKTPPGPPGVTLPGGFTLIQLPKHGANGAFVQPAEVVNDPNTNAMPKPQPEKDVSSTSSITHNAADPDMGEPGLAADQTHTGTKHLSKGRSAESGSSPELICNEKMPSDESDDAEKSKLTRHVESNPDVGSEDVTSDSSDLDVDDDRDDESIDIETVEDTRHRLDIAELKAAANSSLPRIRDSSEDSGSAEEHRVKHPHYNGEDESSRGNRRRNHKVLERLRRSEQRHLFNRLQTVLHSDPRAPKLRLLSMALREIRTLVETSKCLEEKKRRLTQMQSVYVKEISRLSGKPEELVKIKLREIYEKKKFQASQKVEHISPNLRHQPKTHIQNVTAQQPKLQPMSRTKPKVPLAPAPAPVQITTPKQEPQHQPQLAISPAPVQVTAPQSELEDQPSAHRSQVKDEPEAPTQVTAPKTQMEDQLHVPLVPPSSPPPPPKVGAVLDGPQALPSSSSSPAQVFMPQSDLTLQAAVVPPPPMTLPLIRSRTGRIILPSSLKPAGQGYYTLMVMAAEKEKEKKMEEREDGSSMPPSDLDSSKDQEKIASDSEQPSDISEEGKDPDDRANAEEEEEEEEENASSPLDDKTTKSPNSVTRHQALTSPLVELARLNKSIFSPSVTLQPVEQSKEGSRTRGAGKKPTACLSFTPGSPPGSAEEPSPSVVRRGRGRPRKHPPATPIHQNGETSPVEKVKATRAKANKVEVSEAEDSPPPVKRGRGRPPKKKTPSDSKSPGQKNTASSPNTVTRVSRSAVTQEGRNPAKASPPGNRPARSTRNVNIPVTKSKDSPAGDSQLRRVSATRPVTRGALGKDFPSAKKRSWIDVEKELEPEAEAESE
ncbi:MAX gene-associated protein [Polymixia lowei]